MPGRSAYNQSMTFNETNINRDQGGRFDHKVGTDAAVVLERQEAGYGFPAPQADRLDKVAVAVDAVQAGADTPEAIAEALDIDPRQGGYYGDAAGYLGLLSQESENPKRYALTAAGEQYYDASPEDREAILVGLVAETDLVQEYEDRGLAGVEEVLGDRNYAESTASRRAKTAESWSEQVASSGLCTPEAIDAARERARKFVAERPAVQVTAPVKREVCTECWTEKSVSGACMCP